MSSFTNVKLSSTENYDLDDADGKWVLICLTHQEFIQDDNKKFLKSEAKDSNEWCEDCRIDANVTIDEEA